jgi:hypothetical protein
MTIIFAIAFSLTTGVPHTVVPSTFVAGRVFATPLVSNSLRRMVLWLDTDGAGFIRSKAVSELRLQTTTIKGKAAAYLPRFDTLEFPSISADRGALPVLDEADVGNKPMYSEIDGQLGASGFVDRIWTIDYVNHQVWLDHAAPSYHSADAVPLIYDSTHRYPRVQLSIDGATYLGALDTAATIALSEKGASFVGDGLPQVRATSFVRRSTVAGWHAAHPEWAYLAEAGIGPGVSLIRVPEVRANRVVFHNVWFTARANDDVFAGKSVDVELGPTAYGRCSVLLDYVHDVSAFQC